MSQISAIIVNSEIVEIRRDDEGRINLNDLHNASGGAERRKPSLFLVSKKAKKLVESLIGGIPPIKSSRGRYSNGTFAHEDVALAYAAWIDPDFYTTVARSFGHAARGDGEKAVEVARQSVQVREEGKATRKAFSAICEDFIHKTWTMRHVTDKVCKAVTGKGVVKLRNENGFSDTPRNYMSDEELLHTNAIESVAAYKLSRVKSVRNDDILKRIVDESIELVA